jgi:hypothetical protein
MIRPALLVASVALAVAAPSAVRASCMSPQPFLAPGDGATLPADPMIFLFVPEGLYGDARVTMAIDVARAGSAVAHQVEQVSRNPAFTTYRISLATRAPGDLQVAVDFQLGSAPLRSYAARYRVAEEVPAAKPREPGLARPEYESSSWTCSYQSTWNLKPSVDAPAYRVEWAATAEAYAVGQRSFVVLPGHVGRFWREDHRPLGPPQLELGHLNCMDMTLAWPGDRVWVGVWALSADGGEVPLTDEPIPLAKPREG